MSDIDAVALCRALTAIDSRNPHLVAGAPGEGDAARFLGDTLRAWGFHVELQEVLPGRANVVARGGRRGAPSLLFNGHLDVVGTDGMLHAPFAPELRGSRLYGRGSADMKGGIAAMCAAAARAIASGVEAEVIVTAVIDEEYESAGTRALVEGGLRADMAIVTEPTQLAIMPAHRGFVWIDVEVRGRAAHGSRYDLGIDAIRDAALLVAELDTFEREILVQRTHPLLGRASLHASHIAGGIGMSTYPDRCTLAIERRTLPGETIAGVVAEVEAACARVKQRRADFDATVSARFGQPPSDVSTSAPVVRILERALRAEGESVSVAGMSAWTDAAILNEAGIPAICFGPGDIRVAHAAEEWIEVGEIERAARVMERAVHEVAASGRHSA